MTLATGEFIRHYKDYAKHFPMVVRAAWGYTFETATQAIRLVLSGVFDAYPRLKIVLGHLGETLPFLVWRIDQALARPRCLSALCAAATRQLSKDHLTVCGHALPPSMTPKATFALKPPDDHPKSRA